MKKLARNDFAQARGRFARRVHDVVAMRRAAITVQRFRRNRKMFKSLFQVVLGRAAPMPFTLPPPRYSAWSAARGGMKARAPCCRYQKLKSHTDVKRVRMRNNIILEMITTERNYGAQLQTLVRAYMSTSWEDKRLSSRGPRESTCPHGPWNLASGLH